MLSGVVLFNSSDYVIRNLSDLRAAAPVVFRGHECKFERNSRKFSF